AGGYPAGCRVVCFFRPKPMQRWKGARGRGPGKEAGKRGDEQRRAWRRGGREGRTLPSAEENRPGLEPGGASHLAVLGAWVPPLPLPGPVPVPGALPCCRRGGGGPLLGEQRHRI